MGGWTGGRGDCSRVILKLNSVQLQLQLPAGTELGKNVKLNTDYSEQKSNVNGKPSLVV